MSVIITHLLLSCPWWCHPLRLPSTLPSLPPHYSTALPSPSSPPVPHCLLFRVSIFAPQVSSRLFLRLVITSSRSHGGGGGGGGSSSSSSFSSPAPARRPNPSSGASPSSHQCFRHHPLAPRHRRYLPLSRAPRHDKRWLGRRQCIKAYRKFADTHHLHDITTNMASLTTAEALHAILQAPTKLHDMMPKDGSFPIIWDSGASILVTNDKADFLTFTKVSPCHNNVMGVAQGLKFSGFGEVLWSFFDENGTLRSFKLPALYIPSATTHLLSTMSLLQSYSGELIQQTGHGMRLSGTSDGQRSAVEATINPNNNLPTSTGYSYGKVMVAANTLINTMSTTAATNTSLGPAEKELLCWHNRLGHIGMRKVQFLMRTGVLATSEATRRLHTAASELTNLPLCSACQFGKQRRRPEPGKTTTVVREHDGALKDRCLLPGQTVSVDHFVCSTKGRLFTSRGRSKDADTYTGGAIYVDMATGPCGVSMPPQHPQNLGGHCGIRTDVSRRWHYPARISFG